MTTPSHWLVKLALAPALVLIVHILVTVMDGYTLIWWLDNPIHFLGGIAVAISSYFFLQYFEVNQQFSVSWLPLKLLIIFGIVALCAVSWEFLEFYLDLKGALVMHQPSVRDTITDMLMGLLGGMLAAIAMNRRS
jgi:hypothetical protein